MMMRDNLHILSQPKTERRKLAGFSYMLNNVAIITHGILDYINNRNRVAAVSRIVTGLGWMTGAAIISRYGKQAVSRQLERAEHAAISFLEDQGVELDDAQKSIARQEKQRPWQQRMEDFFYNYPTEMLNGLTGLMGITLLTSGYSNYFKQNSPELSHQTLVRDVGSFKKATPGVGEITSGIAVITAATTAILLKEKSPHDLANANFLQKLLHTRPLIISSSIYFGNTLGLLRSVREEYQETHGTKEHRGTGKEHHRYLLRSVSLASILTGQLLIGSSSKKASGSNEEHEVAREKLLEKMRGIIASQEAPQQESIANRLAEYLIQRRELRLEDMKASDIKSKLLIKLGEQNFVERTASHTPLMCVPSGSR